MSEADSKPFPPGAQWRFFVIYVSLFAPYAIITPYFQQLLKSLNYNDVQIGAIQGALELMAVAAPILWGVLADRLSAPRGVLAFTIILSLPMFFLFRFVNGGVAGMVAAVLFGLFYKPNIPLTDGMTFRYIRTKGGDYGKIRIGGTFGYISFIAVFDAICWLTGGVTVQKLIWEFSIAVALQLACLLLVPSYGEEPVATAVATEKKGLSETERSGFIKLFLRPAFLVFMLAAFLGRFSMMSYYSFFSRYLDDVYGVKEVGWIWALGSLCEMPLIFCSKRIIDKIGLKSFFALGLLGCVLRLAGFSVESNIWVVLCLQPLHCLTFGAYHCSTVTYVSRMFPAKLQGGAQGIFSAITVGLGGLLGSAAGGFVLDAFGYTTLFMSFSGVALLSLVICLLFVPKQ
ncbi:MAG: MFS transporter [Victivallales bacterium]|nr:MFS transporter [Victivallales bacterium]